MYEIRVLHSEDLIRLLTMKDVIAAVETAYEQYSNKEAGLFPIIAHEFEQGMREMDIKSGFLSKTGLAGLKIVGYVADNPDKRGIPAISGLVIVVSIETGRPVGILDGMVITNIRTGAAGAIGAKYLARKDSMDVLVVGAGAQGRAQVRGLMAVLPGIRKIWIAGRDKVKLSTYVEEMSAEYVNVNFEALSMNGLESKAAESDIIVTCTPAHKPFIRKEWIRPGTHINAVGADFPGKQEIDETLLSHVRLVADSRIQTLELGEMETAYKKGLICENDVIEIGEIIAGVAPGRQSPDEITLFDATGMALQDIVTANLALARAAEQGIGQLILM